MHTCVYTKSQKYIPLAGIQCILLILWNISLLLLHNSKQILILILNTQCGMTEEQTVHYSRLMQTITLNYKQSQSHYDPPFLFAEVSYARPT